MVARQHVPLLTAAGLGLVLAAAAGCGRGGHDGTTTHADGDTLTVAVIRPGAGTGSADLVLPGRIKAREEVTLTARVPARLTTLPIREGQAFRRGQVLARFDAPETRDAVRSAREALAAAEAHAGQARADAERARALFEKGVLAARDRELVEVRLHEAEAALAGARADMEHWNESAALTAPFAGIVARRHVDPGQTVLPGQAVLDLRSRDVGEIEAAVPESALPMLERSAIAFQAGDGDWMPASLLRVDGMTDPATRTRLATFRPASAKGLDAGGFARVRVTPRAAEAGGETLAAGASPVFAVPASSIVRRGALTGVFVVREGRAWLRWLRVGRAADGRVEVLAGLTADDLVVAQASDLTDGRPVRVSP